MTEVAEGGLRFQFPQGWLVEKYDAWSFVSRLSSACGGMKALDLLALDPGGQLWLIEVKDYRNALRSKDLDLCDEVAMKVRDTLAGLVAASHQAVEGERGAARRFLGAKRLAVVLHLERAAHKSKLFAEFPETVDLVDKLKQLLKPIDPHPRVVAINRPLSGSPWKVESVTQ